MKESNKEKQNENLDKIIIERVYNDIVDEQIETYYKKGKQIMNYKEITKHIMENFDEYINEDEKEQLIISWIGEYRESFKDDEMLNYKIEELSHFIKFSMEAIINEDEDEEDMPYNPIDMPVPNYLMKLEYA